MYDKLNDHLLLKYFDEMEIKEIKNVMLEKSFKDDENIITIGERNRDLMYLKKGKTSVWDVIRGEKIEFTQLQEGSLIGEINFVIPSSRTANVSAIGDVVFEIYPFKEMMNFFKERPLMASKFFLAVNEALAGKFLPTLNKYITKFDENNSLQ